MLVHQRRVSTAAGLTAPEQQALVLETVASYLIKWIGSFPTCIPALLRVRNGTHVRSYTLRPSSRLRIYVDHHKSQEVTEVRR